MNDILIAAIVIMMICIVTNFISLFYRIDKIKEIEIELEKLEEDFDIMKNYINGYQKILLKMHGDDGK